MPVEDFRCEYEYPESTLGQAQNPICGSADVVAHCCDCGRKLCRKHSAPFGGRRWCGDCMEEQLAKMTVIRGGAAMNKDVSRTVDKLQDNLRVAERRWHRANQSFVAAKTKNDKAFDEYRQAQHELNTCLEEALSAKEGQKP